ncbi:hypothetical protein AgCh_031402 [Apium graveolens]
MGNCIKKQSSMEWGGDDWSDDYSPSDSPQKKMNQNKHHDYDTNKQGKSGSLPTTDDFTDNLKEAPKQVKLKITRKQLQQVLELTKTNAQGVSVQQVLAHLINVGINDLQSNQTRSWRPDLPTITEV